MRKVKRVEFNELTFAQSCVSAAHIKPNDAARHGSCWMVSWATGVKATCLQPVICASIQSAVTMLLVMSINIYVSVYSFVVQIKPSWRMNPQINLMI